MKYNSRIQLTLVLAPLFALFLSCAPRATADTVNAALQPKPASFLPIWRLLSQDQKEQFLAGYIQGWRDAAKVTDIAIAYVKDNPQNAVQGLERLKSLYDLSDVKPNSLVHGIDRFYANPENRDATLSLAVTAAQSDT